MSVASGGSPRPRCQQTGRRTGPRAVWRAQERPLFAFKWSSTQRNSPELGAFTRVKESFRLRSLRGHKLDNRTMGHLCHSGTICHRPSEQIVAASRRKWYSPHFQNVAFAKICQATKWQGHQHKTTPMTGPLTDHVFGKKAACDSWLVSQWVCPSKHPTAAQSLPSSLPGPPAAWHLGSQPAVAHRWL